MNDKIVAFMEFERGLGRHMPKLKQSFRDILYLEPIDENGKRINLLKTVKPTYIRLKSDESNVLVVDFEPNSLQASQCYMLKIGDIGQHDGIDKMYDSRL